LDICKYTDMKGGWFVGNFVPSAYQTEACEVCYKSHPKGERWDRHYHKVATEINLLVRGQMLLQGVTLKQGDVFVVRPGEVADPVFLEDCEVVVVKVPSCPGDKYVVETPEGD